MNLPIAFVVTRIGMFIGEVDTTESQTKVYKPMAVTYQQTPTGLTASVSPYPPGVKGLVDDLEGFFIKFQEVDVFSVVRPAEELKDEYIKGSNAFRNIAVPTTGQIIDVEANK